MTIEIIEIDVADRLRTLSERLALPVVAVRRADGIWAVELYDGRVVALGTDDRVSDNGHISQALRRAGAHPARFRKGAARRVRLTLHLIHDHQGGQR